MKKFLSALLIICITTVACNSGGDNSNVPKGNDSAEIHAPDSATNPPINDSGIPTGKDTVKGY